MEDKKFFDSKVCVRFAPTNDDGQEGDADMHSDQENDPVEKKKVNFGRMLKSLQSVALDTLPKSVQLLVTWYCDTLESKAQLSHMQELLCNQN